MVCLSHSEYDICFLFRFILFLYYVLRMFSAFDSFRLFYSKSLQKTSSSTNKEQISFPVRTRIVYSSERLRISLSSSSPPSSSISIAPSPLKPSDLYYRSHLVSIRYVLNFPRIISLLTQCSVVFKRNLYSQRQLFEPLVGVGYSVLEC